MSSKPLIIDDVLEVDRLGCHIASYWVSWDRARSPKIRQWEEVQRYIFATSTSHTTNAQLPWSNKTTLPKLCQIRDNLFANYMAALFPKRKWVRWMAMDEEADTLEKREAIEAYTDHMADNNEFRSTMRGLIYDYIDTGNVFATVDWTDDRHITTEVGEGERYGYVGPVVRRISPYDIVFDPTATSFKYAPKVVRSIVSLGEIRDMLESQTGEDGDREDAKAIWDYMRSVRQQVTQYEGSTQTRDELYDIAGFESYQHYLASERVEILTFYGDYLDEESGEFKKNRVVRVVDRHKVISDRVNPTYFGTGNIFHTGWRGRPDNLWAMGPLENLVGLQYRIDHLENMKADLWDLTAFPPLKIKGYVEDFTWGPFEHIYVGDDGDVEMMAPHPQVLQADQEIMFLQQQMEEMAGAPREAMGIRSPGEKTKYEVQRLESAAGRLFQSKITQFEEDLLENVLNAMIEMARRLMTGATIKVFDTELKASAFEDITADDIVGNGRIKPYAARHFAEQANMVQNLNQFFASPAYQAVAMHVSTVKTAALFEDLLEVTDFDIVQPFVALDEQAEVQKRNNVQQENIMVESQLPTGTAEDDIE